ncbi:MULTISPECIES: GNAT family N-acetyltransferase [unclassified Microbacterium]|uniref:GNAT family N-acetyltransferase n=1 Tax=unclassified Microbacterium TaxID=2609290 RepID=UPI0020168CA2|nr:GNAT family N-acetyltransferase [Microbacterium sp. JB110]
MIPDMSLRVEVVDRADVRQLLQWNRVLRDGYAVGRQQVWFRSDDATLAQFQDPHPARTSALLIAKIGDVPVGAAEASVDPDEPAEVEVAVLDGFRRRGVGRMLLDAVRDTLRGTATILRTETYSDAGVTFARAEGLNIGIRESRQMVELPLSTAQLAAFPDAPAGINLRSWCGRCPDEVVEDWAELRARMSDDVPMGDLSRSPASVDVDAVRRNERRMHDQGYLLVRSLACTNGDGIGYTEILLSRSDPEIVNQDDTFVDKNFRGRGIGRALKAANLRLLMSVPESAESRSLQTYTALTNEPMLALNRSVGFHGVDTLTVLEGPLG